MSTLFYERRQMTLGDLGEIPDFIAPTEGIRIERCRIPDIRHILRIFRRDFRNFIAGRRTERNPIDIMLVFHTEIIRRFYGITVGKTHNRIHSANIGIVAVFFKHNIDITETVRYCVLIQRGYASQDRPLRRRLLYGKNTELPGLASTSFIAPSPPLESNVIV